MAITNALQLEAAQCHVVAIHFNTSPVASFKSLSLFVAILECFYCWYITLHCNLELWPRDLDLWPLDLERLWYFRHHVFKLCIKFEHNWTIHCRVIDDLAHFWRGIFKGVPFTRKVLRGVWTELHQTWRGHRAIIWCAHRVCFRVEISCCIFKCWCLIVEQRWKWCQISHFLTPCKN